MNWSRFSNPARKVKSRSDHLGYSLVNDDGWIAVQLVTENELGCVSTVMWRSPGRVAGSVIQDELPIQLPRDNIDSSSYGSTTRWKVYPEGRLRRQWELTTPNQGRVASRHVGAGDVAVQARRTRVLEQLIEREGRKVRRFDLSKGRATKWLLDAFGRWAALVTTRSTADPQVDAFWERLYDEADQAFGRDKGYVIVNQLYNDLGADRAWGAVNPGDVVVLRKGKKVLATAGRVPTVNWCETLPEDVSWYI
jgi:hypothetical protein